MTNIRIFSLIIGAFLLFWPESICAQKAGTAVSATFLQITAQKGDDVPKLLSRYCLDEHDCNVNKFFKINKLRDGDYRLAAGRMYFLPIQLHRYNGKSIRSTLGIDDWEKAKRIDQFNKKAQKDGVRLDNFIESKNLWVPWHEIECNSIAIAQASVKPATPKTATGKGTTTKTTTGGEPVSSANKRSFPIFGPNYAYTPLASSKLKGRIFYIVSGHGGPDSGAQGKRAGNTLCEDEYAYDVSLRLLRLLISHGATAYMIVRDPNDGIRDDAYLKCDRDEEVWGGRNIPVNQKERLGQRTDVINTLTEHHNRLGQTNQTVIEIHVDSRSVATETDVFFYYRPNSETSLNLALRFHETFLQRYREKRGPTRRYTGTVSARDLYTLRETNTPVAVYIELANIKNDWDQQRLVLKNNRQAIANWLAQALLK